MSDDVDACCSKSRTSALAIASAFLIMVDTTFPFSVFLHQRDEWREHIARATTHTNVKLAISMLAIWPVSSPNLTNNFLEHASLKSCRVSRLKVDMIFFWKDFVEAMITGMMVEIANTFWKMGGHVTNKGWNRGEFQKAQSYFETIHLPTKILAESKSGK